MCVYSLMATVRGTAITSYPRRLSPSRVGGNGRTSFQSGPCWDFPLPFQIQTCTYIATYYRPNATHSFLPWHRMCNTCARRLPSLSFCSFEHWSIGIASIAINLQVWRRAGARRSSPHQCACTRTFQPGNEMLMWLYQSEILGTGPVPPHVCTFA